MFRRLWNWLKSTLSKLESLKDKYLPVAVNVVQAVKKAIESGTFDVVAGVIKTLIPGTIDDDVIDSIVKYTKERIPFLCVELQILKATNGNDIDKALAALKLTYGDKWEQFTSGLAGELLTFLADDKIDVAEAKILAKKFYDEYIKKY